MIRAYARLTVLGLLTVVGFGQSTPNPTFDLADVHVSAKRTNANMTGGVLRGGRYELRNATMVDLIRIAYGVEAEKVLGGPNWLEFDRFDVSAKAPTATPPETLQLMLQALLADRFKLVVHKDSKSLSVFVLSMGKGKHKLKEAEGAGTGCQPQPQTPQPGVIPQQAVSCHGITMETLALLLRQAGGGYITSTVVDQTGLKGSWDFDLKWTARGLLAQAGADGISLFDAVDKQLGLKVEPQQLALPVIVVDQVSQKPTDNPPGVAAAIPGAPPAEFEAADVKPSVPGSEGTRIQFQPGGRLDVQGAPLKLLIQAAWDINNDEMLVGGPKFLDTARFDIVAKASTAMASNGQQVDTDALRLMLRALIVDRFKLKTHTEERPATAYTLTALKPKFQKADPANRTNWKEGPAAGARDPRLSNPSLARLVTCQNMTMAQFAELLPGIAGGYIRGAPVFDNTGLDGAWEFTFNFSPIGIFQGGAGARGAGGRGAEQGPAAGGTSAAAADPTGAVSLFDALERQLGLKLETEKRPIPVLVIDHVEEKPTDN
jgi:uncharacterized protein (TIGR03435 family)